MLGKQIRVRQIVRKILDLKEALFEETWEIFLRRRNLERSSVVRIFAYFFRSFDVKCFDLVCSTLFAVRIVPVGANLLSCRKYMKSCAKRYARSTLFLFWVAFR
jgi:hypothetical protein